MSLDAPVADPHPAFERLLYDLVVPDAAAVSVAAAVKDLVELAFVSGSRALLVRYVAGEEARLTERLAAILKNARGPLEIALVGGPPQASAALRQAKPGFTRASVALYHLRDDGTLWKSSGFSFGARPLRHHLEHKPIQGPATPEGWAQLEQRLQQDPTTAPVLKEAREFAAVLGQRRPIATWTLAALMAALFLLEMALGGSESTPVLTRMGALVPSRLAQGEYWRLFSCGFLHAGWVHFGMNTYVLIVAGDVMERLLGTWRFLVLFWLSVLGASLASLAFGSAGLTVGASGGLWGILVAEGVLAFRPRGLLPQVIIPRARRGAATNLVLNALVSLRPHVAFAAHLGGGLVGAALLAGSLLVKGLPKLGEAEQAVRKDVLPVWVKPVACLGVALMAGSLGAALTLGQPLRLALPPSLVAVPIGATGSTVEIPDDLAPLPIEDRHTTIGEMTVASFGDVLRDPFVLSVNVTVFTSPIAPEATESELAELSSALSHPPRGFTVDGAPSRTTLRGLPAIVVRSTSPNGLVLEQAATLAPDRLVTAEVVYWPEFAERGAGVASHTLAAMR